MFTSEKQMEHACERYLVTREHWFRKAGSERVRAQFNSATDFLFAAFAFDWSADEKLLPEAFSRFQKALVTWGDGDTA